MMFGGLIQQMLNNKYKYNLVEDTMGADICQRCLKPQVEPEVPKFKSKSTQENNAQVTTHTDVNKHKVNKGYSQRNLNSNSEAPLVHLSNANDQQIKNTSKNRFEIKNRSNQLIEKQKTLKSSSQYQKAQRKESNIEELLQISARCHELQLYQEQKKFFKQAQAKVQQIQKKYSEQSIAQIKAHIFTQLFDLISVQNKNEEQADKYFNKAIESFDKTILAATIQERITLLNNYSVFKKNCKDLQRAKIHLQQAIKLMDNYFLASDQRKFLALINLACIQYDNSEPKKAQQTQQKIRKQCKNKQILRYADKILTSYK